MHTIERLFLKKFVINSNDVYAELDKTLYPATIVSPMLKTFYNRKPVKKHVVSYFKLRF